jgi:hypothetical protein
MFIRQKPPIKLFKHVFRRFGKLLSVKEVNVCKEVLFGDVLYVKKKIIMNIISMNLQAMLNEMRGLAKVSAVI